MVTNKNDVDDENVIIDEGPPIRMVRWVLEKMKNEQRIGENRLEVVVESEHPLNPERVNTEKLETLPERGVYISNIF